MRQGQVRGEREDRGAQRDGVCDRGEHGYNIIIAFELAMVCLSFLSAILMALNLASFCLLYQMTLKLTSFCLYVLWDVK